MTHAIQVVPEPLVCAAKRELLPGEPGCVELRRLGGLIVDAQRPANRRRGVDDDDRRAAKIGVNVDQRVEPDVEAAFLARLADRGIGERLAAIDVAAGKHPLAVPWLDRAADEHDAVIRGFDDRADGDLRIEVDNEPAARADGSLWFGG